MKLHEIIQEQFIPASIEKCWTFFSSPENLQIITPDDLDFKILTKIKREEALFSGQIIQYTIRLFPLIKLRWVTEITHCKTQQYFIDEQRFGPYSFWHHRHHFKVVPGGVLMTDHVHYRLPYGIIGELAHWIFIRKKLNHIFHFRKQKIDSVFSS